MILLVKYTGSGWPEPGAGGGEAHVSAVTPAAFPRRSRGLLAYRQGWSRRTSRPRRSARRRQPRFADDIGGGLLVTGSGGAFRRRLLKIRARSYLPVSMELKHEALSLAMVVALVDPAACNHRPVPGGRRSRQRRHLRDVETLGPFDEVGVVAIAAAPRPASASEKDRICGDVRRIPSMGAASSPTPRSSRRRRWCGSPKGTRHVVLFAARRGGARRLRAPGAAALGITPMSSASGRRRIRRGIP